jgi:mRNA interferase HigB
MQLIGMEVLTDFIQYHPDTQGPLEAWTQEVQEAAWRTPADLKARYPSASILSDNRVVFNIKGNKYRLLTKVGFNLQTVQVLKMGTHEEYDKWDL